VRVAEALVLAWECERASRTSWQAQAWNFPSRRAFKNGFIKRAWHHSLFQSAFITFRLTFLIVKRERTFEFINANTRTSHVLETCFSPIKFEYGHICCTELWSLHNVTPVLPNCKREAVWLNFKAAIRVRVAEALVLAWECERASRTSWQAQAWNFPSRRAFKNGFIKRAWHHSLFQSAFITFRLTFLVVKRERTFEFFGIPTRAYKGSMICICATHSMNLFPFTSDGTSFILKVAPTIQTCRPDGTTKSVTISVSIMWINSDFSRNVALGANRIEVLHGGPVSVGRESNSEKWEKQSKHAWRKDMICNSNVIPTSQVNW